MRKRVWIEGLFFGWKLIRLTNMRVIISPNDGTKPKDGHGLRNPLPPFKWCSFPTPAAPATKSPFPISPQPNTHTHTLSLSLSLSLSPPKLPSNIQRPLHWDSSLYNLQTSKNKLTAYSKYWVLSNWFNFNSRDEKSLDPNSWLLKQTWTSIQSKNHWYRVAGTRWWLLWVGNEPTQREQQTKRRGTFCNVNKTYEKYQGSWTAVYLKLQFDQYLI